MAQALEAHTEAKSHGKGDDRSQDDSVGALAGIAGALAASARRVRRVHILLGNGGEGHADGLASVTAQDAGGTRELDVGALFREPSQLASLLTWGAKMHGEGKRAGFLTLYRAEPLVPRVTTWMDASWPSDTVTGTGSLGRQSVPLPVLLRKSGVSETLKLVTLEPKPRLMKM